eukprot:355380-Chlamydomonas_euryale.AAC.1
MLTHPAGEGAGKSAGKGADQGVGKGDGKGTDKDAGTQVVLRRMPLHTLRLQTHSPQQPTLFALNLTVCP